jgi:hypothetical protein
MHLLIILILRIITSILLLSRLGLLSPNTTRTSTTEGRAESEIDVLLGIETNNEGRNVDDLLANTDVSLTDENTSVVDGLGKTELVDTGLQTTLQEILDLQGQHVIELHAGFVKNTNTDETANEGISFEESLGVLLIEGEQLTVVVSVIWFPIASVDAYRAARRILERVSWTRQTSRLLRSPYSPTSFNSESLGHN